MKKKRSKKNKREEPAPISHFFFHTQKGGSLIQIGDSPSIQTETLEKNPKKKRKKNLTKILLSLDYHSHTTHTQPAILLSSHFSFTFSWYPYTLGFFLKFIHKTLILPSPFLNKPHQHMIYTSTHNRATLHRSPPLHLACPYEGFDSLGARIEALAWKIRH